MKKYIAVLCCLLSVLSIQAQDESRQKDVETLFEWFKKASGFDVVLALYQHCTLKDDISYLLPT